MLMRYNDNVGSGAVLDLSLTEIELVHGGEAPNWAVNGRGPDLNPPSAADVERGANTVNAMASVAQLRFGNSGAGRIAAGIAAASAAVSAAAQWVQGGDEKPGKADQGKVKQK